MSLLKYNEYLEEFKKKTINLIVDMTSDMIHLCNDVNDRLITYSDDHEFNYEILGDIKMIGIIGGKLDFEFLAISGPTVYPNSLKDMVGHQDLKLKMGIDSNIKEYDIDYLTSLIDILSNEEANLFFKIDIRLYSLTRKTHEDIHEFLLKSFSHLEDFKCKLDSDFSKGIILDFKFQSIS